MNLIHIEGKIFIEVDERSAVIKEFTGKFDKQNPGKELYNILGEFSKVQGAVKKLLRLNIARSKTKDLNELLERLNDIEWKIEDAMNKTQTETERAKDEKIKELADRVVELLKEKEEVEEK